MPNWKIHLEVGKRLNNYLKLDSVEYQEFLLGNILPDINNSYIVKDIQKRIGHDITHFDNKKDYCHHLLFLNKYQDKINNPIYLGYYVHLYTDYFFNKNFYELVKNRKLDYIEKETLRIIKQQDFNVFNNNYLSNTITLDNIDDVLLKIDIDEVKLCKNDILNVIRYLNNTPMFQGEYQIYREDELEELLDNCVLEIKNNLENMKKGKRLKKD